MRQSFIRCPGNNCGADLSVKVARAWHTPWGFNPEVSRYRMTDHVSRCPSCKTDWSQSGWPEYPQHELAAAFAEGEEA